MDWAQKDRDSEGIHLVLLEHVTGQSVISAVSAPRQRVSLCVPIIAPYIPCLPASNLHYEISHIYEIARFSRDRCRIRSATCPRIMLKHNELTQPCYANEMGDGPSSSVKVMRQPCYHFERRIVTFRRGSLPFAAR